MTCGLNITCGSYAAANSISESDFVQRNIKTMSINAGYNFFWYDFVVKQGYLFRVKYLMNPTNTSFLGKLAINANPGYPDRYLTSGMSLINGSPTHNFYFRSAVDNIGKF